jgi:hypothetical protein
MMSAFLATLTEDFRRKMWKQEKLLTTMLEFSNIIIHLGNACDLGELSNPPKEKPPFEQSHKKVKQFKPKPWENKVGVQNDKGSKNPPKDKQKKRTNVKE